jgi:hypothetical protein
MTASPEAAASERPPGGDGTGRYPDFFIVGHAKSGTTALYEILARHPQVFMPIVKEPQYFARNPAQVAGAAAVPVFERTGRTAETLAQYLSLFAGARTEQQVGEASTFYLWSPHAPERIAAAQPRAKIIAILREPVSFVRSLHLQMRQNQTEDERDLRRAIELEDERRQGRRIPRRSYWPSALMYTDRVHYVEQLERYRRHFPAEQLLVLIYDDFRADNEATVRQVLRFLEVDDTVSVQAFDANPSVALRSLLLARTMRSLRSGRTPLSRAAKTGFQRLTPSSLRRAVLYPARRRLLYSQPAEPDEALTRELRERFRGEVAALSEYLGRDLMSLWGYGDGS